MVNTFRLVILFFLVCSWARATISDRGDHFSIHGHLVYKAEKELYWGLVEHLKSVNLKDLSASLEKMNLNWQKSHQDEDLKTYYLNQLSNYIRTSSTNLNRAIAQTQELQCNNKYPVSLSLIPFKRGDIRDQCQLVINKSLAMKAKSVSFFYPVHYSGGNSNSLTMPKNPHSKRDYQFEVLGMPSIEESKDCLKKIITSGLKVNYIPHLESIKNLNSTSMKEWRLLSGIPLDDEYHKLAYGPLLSLISDKEIQSKKAEIVVSMAAEVDIMFFSSVESVHRNLLLIKDQFKKTPLSLKFSFNPNGDFKNGWDLSQFKKPNCGELSKLMNDIEQISPSIYGEHNHISFVNGKVDAAETKKRFFTELNKKVDQLCPDYNLQLDKKIFSFGEFALSLNDKDQKYSDFFQSFPIAEIKEVTFWNLGKWDHLTENPDSALLKALACR